MKRRDKWNVLLGALAFCFVLGTAGVAGQAAEEDTVIPGVYIDEIDLQGMNLDEIEEAVSDYADELMKKKVTITVGEEKVSSTLKDLGLVVPEHELAEEALAVGKSGNLIKRYKVLKDLETEPMVLSLGKEIDSAELDKLVEACQEFDQEAKNAGLKRENGKFVYTDEQVGRVVDLNATRAALDTLVAGNLAEELTMEATVVEEEPQYTREMVEKCNTVIGSYTTGYASSSSARAGNVANATSKINGKVLYPGEECSVYEMIQPFTTANGYYMAGAYQNGREIDSLGGGVCQVSTTLYNAALYAEMEITQRAEHSMLVGYVDPARDAAIAGTYKDLKFKNPTDTPIYIEGVTANRKLTFTIYGEAKPAGREVKLISVTTSTKAPGPDKEIEDPTKPVGYRKVEQSAHVGKTATLYMAIIQDGVEISREIVNKSSYMSSPRYVTVGTKEVEEEDPKEEDPKAPEEGEEPEETDTPETPTEGESTSETAVDAEATTGEE